MIQLQEDAVIGQVLRERADAQYQVELLTAEAENVSRKLMSLADDLFYSPHTITTERLEEIDGIKILMLVNMLVRAKAALTRAEDAAAKWRYLESRRPHPFFCSYKPQNPIPSH